jgi:hypothetical protein
MSFVLIKLYKKMQFNKRGRFFSQRLNFMHGHSGGIIWKRVGNTAQENIRNFPWYSASTVLNSSNILVALPSRESSPKIFGLHLLGENSKMGKDEILSCLCKKTNFPYEQWVLPASGRTGSKHVQEFDYFFFQCTITNFFRISRLICWCRIAKTDLEMSILYLFYQQFILK